MEDDLEKKEFAKPAVLKDKDSFSVDDDEFDNDFEEEELPDE